MRSRLQSAIETKLAALPSSIIATHAKDIHISGTSTPTGVTSSPSPSPVPLAAAAAKAAAPASKLSEAAKQKLNTSTVVVEATFQAAADDLYSLLTDEKRIPMWTRNAAVVCLFCFEIYGPVANVGV